MFGLCVVLSVVVAASQLADGTDDPLDLAVFVGAAVGVVSWGVWRLLGGNREA